jgi:chromosome partitioning protein
VDTRTNLAREAVAQLRERFGPLVLKAVVRENVRLAEAPSFHQPITVYAPASTGCADYRAVARELVRRAQKGKR